MGARTAGLREFPGQIWQATSDWSEGVGDQNCQFSIDWSCPDEYEDNGISWT